MPNPKVSVLIPAYNYAQYLPEAIESVLAQTYSDFELIIVDNCSTDNTEDIVQKYSIQDQRIQYIKNQENIGMFRNYNQALLYAKGDYIKFLNADDLLYPHALRSFLDIFENYPNVSLVTSHKKHIGLREFIGYQELLGEIDGQFVISSVLKNGNWIGEPTTVMFKKELNIGLFEPSLLYFADVDMWLKILSSGNLFVIDDILSIFRIHSEQGTVHLHSSSDKIIFNMIEWIEYVRFAIQSNRFRYDFTQEGSTFYFQKNQLIGFVTHFKLFFKISNEKTRFKNFCYAYIFLIIYSLPLAIKAKLKRLLQKQ